MKYRKKPVVIDAVQLIDGCGNDMENLFGTCDVIRIAENGEMEIAIDTLEGVMIARQLDYIIKGVQGEFYPVKNDIFELTYELLEDNNG